MGTRRWRLRPAPCPYVTHGDVAAENFVLFECNRRASDPHPPMVWLSVIFAVIDTVLRVPSNFRATPLRVAGHSNEKIGVPQQEKHQPQRLLGM